jgi:CheY-like chemotaxis protein
LRAAAREQIPAVALTGDVRAATLLAIAESGCAALNKPIEPKELLQVIQQRLGDHAR